MYAFIGPSISTSFSLQGAAKALGPVLAHMCGCCWAWAAGGGCRHAATAADFFALAAASMVALGALSALSVVYALGAEPAPVPISALSVISVLLWFRAERGPDGHETGIEKHKTDPGFRVRAKAWLNDAAAFSCVAAELLLHGGALKSIWLSM